MNRPPRDADGSGEFAVGFGPDVGRMDRGRAHVAAADAVEAVKAAVLDARRAFADRIVGCLEECRAAADGCYACVQGHVYNYLEEARRATAAVREAVNNAAWERVAAVGDAMVNVYRLIPEAVTSDESPAEPAAEPSPPPAEPVDLAAVLDQLRAGGEAYRGLIATPGAVDDLSRGVPLGSITGTDTAPVPTDDQGNPTTTTGGPHCGPPTKYCPAPWTPITDLNGNVTGCWATAVNGQKIVVPANQHPATCPDPYVGTCPNCHLPNPPPPPPDTIPCPDLPDGAGGCIWVAQPDGTQRLTYVYACYDPDDCCWSLVAPCCSSCRCGVSINCAEPVCVTCNAAHFQCDCLPGAPRQCPEGFHIDLATQTCVEDDVPPPVTDPCQRPDDADPEAQLLSTGDGFCRWTDPDGTQHGDPCPDPLTDANCPKPPGTPCAASLVTLKGGYRVWKDGAGNSYPPRCAPGCGLAAVVPMPDDAPDDAVIAVWDDGSAQWFDPETGTVFGDAVDLPCPWPEDAPDNACLITRGDPPCQQWVGPDGTAYGDPCPVNEDDQCGPQEDEPPDPDVWQLGDFDGTMEWPPDPELVPADQAEPREY